MDRIGTKLWPAAQSRSRTSLCVNSASQSGSGAVMTTSQTSSTAGWLLLLELVDESSCFVLGLRHAAPSGHDCSVVAQPDPAAGHVDAMRVHDEVHGPLGPDRAVAGGVPAHQDFVVPQTKFSTPEIAAFIDRPSTSRGLYLDQLAV